MWYLYIIENRFGHLYTGICKDVARRFEEHQAGGKRCARALRGKGPITLRFSCQVGDHSTALRSELAVKKLNTTAKWEIIDGGRTLPTLR